MQVSQPMKLIEENDKDQIEYLKSNPKVYVQIYFLNETNGKWNLVFSVSNVKRYMNSRVKDKNSLEEEQPRITIKSKGKGLIEIRGHIYDNPIVLFKDKKTCNYAKNLYVSSVNVNAVNPLEVKDRIFTN